MIVLLNVQRHQQHSLTAKLKLEQLVQLAAELARRKGNRAVLVQLTRRAVAAELPLHRYR